MWRVECGAFHIPLFERKEDMLVLCSNGLSSPELIERILPAAKGCTTAALVVTADPVYKEQNYHVPRCRQTLEALGLEVTVFDLDIQPASELLSFDVVEFIGGNPFYLLDALRKQNARPILEVLAQQKLLIGWSAAAFVFGPSLKLVNQYSPEMNYLNLTDLNGLSLSDLEVLPHYSRFLAKFEAFEEICRRYENEHQLMVLRLNDGDGIMIEGNKTVICRGFQSEGSSL